MTGQQFIIKKRRLERLPIKKLTQCLVCFEISYKFIKKLLVKFPLTTLFMVFISIAFSQQCYSQQFIDHLKLKDHSGSYVILREARNDYAFGLTDADDNVKWQIPVKGYPFGLAHYNGQVVVLYDTDSKQFTPISNVHAMLIDPVKRKILKDISVYKYSGNFSITVNLLTSSSNEFCKILVRETTRSQGGFGIYSSRGSVKKTEELLLISLENDFNPQISKVNSAALESDFISSEMGNCNELYICTYKDGKVVMEEFDENGKKTGELSTDFTYRKKTEYRSLILYDSSQEKSVDLVMNFYDDKKNPHNQFYTFDFENKKVIRADDIVLNKDYLKTLSGANPGSKLTNLKYVKFLKPIQLLFTPELTILISEIQFLKYGDKGQVEQYLRYGAVVSFYSKDLKILKEIPIDKWSSNGLMELNQIAGHLKGDKLYLVTNEKDGLGFKAQIYIINMKDYSMTSRLIPDPQSGINWITTPSDVTWYDDYFMVPFVKSKLSVRLKMKTEWVKEKY